MDSQLPSSHNTSRWSKLVFDVGFPCWHIVGWLLGEFGRYKRIRYNDFIRGTEKRRNRAKSWCWTGKKANHGYSGEEGTGNDNDAPTEKPPYNMSTTMETELKSRLLEVESVWHGKIPMDMQKD